MSKKYSKQSPIQWSPLAAAIAVAVGSLAQVAMAADEDTTRLESVTVTGSRIKKAEVEGQAPVFTLERKDLENTGLGTVGDILQQLTTGGKALNAKFNSSGNFGFPADGGGIGAGSSQVDLRNLESKRVLVLVDGLRWVNESSASGVGGSVDLNTIPLAIVERIEVLEDGASAIYGSDAIAGVINIITRRKYDGAEVNAYYGEYDKGDGETTRADLTIGGGNDRFNAVFSASYFDQKRVASKDRALATEPVPGTGVTRGSSGTPQGRFIFCDPRVTPDCSNGDNYLDLTLNDGAVPQYTPGGANTYHGFTLQDRFNFAPFNLVLTPSERKSLFTAGRYQLTDSTSLYFKALYNTRDSVNQAAPEPIFIGGDAGTGGIADTISISRLNPFNPTGIDLIAGQNFSLFGRRPLEAGPRIFKQSVDTYYVAGGFEGRFDWGSRGFSWDLNAIKSNNSAEQQFYNGFNLGHLKLALGDPTVCAQFTGCVPFNIFGGQGPNGQGTITQEMLDYVRVTTKDSSEQDLKILSGNLTGDIFDLPAGPLGFATGVEYRKYAAKFVPDSLRITGESQDSRATLTQGDYDVKEIYAEFNAPLVKDAAFAKSLDLSFAVRYSDYSSFGSKTTTKFGLRWQPIDDLLLRGTYSEGFRAPFVGELFGLTQFGPTLTDPCSNSVNPGDNSTLAQNCRALGVPNGYEQINTQITTNTGGNPNLQPEESKSYTAGFVYSPAWAENLPLTRRADFEATYYHHKIDHAVQALDAQVQLDSCVASGDPNSVFCQGITRTPNGQINRFDNLLQNIGKIETSGVDLKFNWSSVESDWGRLSGSVESTHVIKYKASDTLGNVFQRRVGVEVNDSAIPSWQTNVNIDWNYADWSAGVNVRYISGVEESCSDFRDGTSLSLTSLGLCSDPSSVDDSLSINRLGSTAYTDLHVAYTTAFGVNGLTLRGGVNNLFDRDPPTCLSCSLNGYDAGTYELPGQFYYVEVGYKF